MALSLGTSPGLRLCRFAATLSTNGHLLYVWLVFLFLFGCAPPLHNAGTLIYSSPLNPLTPHAETLDRYFPIDPATPSSGWRLVNYLSYRAGVPKEVRTIRDQPLSTSTPEEYLWFGVPSQSGEKNWHIEHYRRCGDWLWFDAFVAVQKKGANRLIYPVVATKILLTRNGKTTNFLLSKEYSQCVRNNIGHPYLPWRVDTAYRLQIWGTFANDTATRWYWDAIFHPPSVIYNPCWPGPENRRTAIGITEAWWRNKPGEVGGAWGIGEGEMKAGIPSGVITSYGRTVYHAEGPIPYWLTASPRSGAINACIDSEWPISTSPSSPQTSFPALYP